jgi:hypothetical protein
VERTPLELELNDGKRKFEFAKFDFVCMKAFSVESDLCFA